jgi:hypothetical protein
VWLRGPAHVSILVVVAHALPLRRRGGWNTIEDEAFKSENSLELPERSVSSVSCEPEEYRRCCERRIIVECDHVRIL